MFTWKYVCIPHGLRKWELQNTNTSFPLQISLCFQLSPKSCKIKKTMEDEMFHTVLMAVRWRRSRMASGGGPDEERGHRGRNTELRRSISDMNLTLRRRQGNQASNDSRRSGNAITSGGAQDRKNIVSMIASETGQVRDKEGQRGG